MSSKLTIIVVSAGASEKGGGAGGLAPQEKFPLGGCGQGFS